MQDTYKLTEGDKILAHRMAEMREHDWYENSAYGYSAYQVHLMGAKAEIVTGKLYSLPIDIKDRPYGDNCDFKIERYGDTQTVDVKATTKPAGDLLVRQDTNTNDYYLLFHIASPLAEKVRLLGWASKEQVKAGNEEVRQDDEHKNYRLTTDELHSPPQNLRQAQ